MSVRFDIDSACILFSCNFSLIRYVTVSMTVGPASGVLKDQPQDTWRAKDVALTVLNDRWGKGWRVGAGGGQEWG